MTYADRCAVTHGPLGDLRATLLGDLNPVRGGFGWWHGYLDEPRIVLASDYLIGVAGTVARSLTRAAFHERAFTTIWTTKSNRLLQVGGTRDVRDLAAVLHRGPADDDRDIELEAHRHGFFTAVGSALDQMAALTVGVAAIKMPIVKADWGRLRDLPTDVNVASKALDAPGTAGRALQGLVLASISTVVDGQPAGWLGWTVDTRNTLVHRADRSTFMFFHRPSRQSVLGLLSLMSRHPRQTDAEAFASNSRRGREDGVAGVVLHQGTCGLMAGTLDCTLHLVAELSAVLLGVWSSRRVEPAVLVQPGQQWKNLWQGKAASFNGYAPLALPPPSDAIALAPEMARRMAAAKLLDVDQAFWDGLREEHAEDGS